MGKQMTVKIANASGFWGDNPDAPESMLENCTGLDYLTFDYLAEVTMTVLARQQESDPSLGYARDFPRLLADILPTALDDDVTIVANAGGLNPSACRDAILDIAAEQGLSVRIGTVSNDDFRDDIDSFDDLRHMITDEPLPSDADVTAANAYFGAYPIASALDDGADVVVTGRVIDAATVMGPLIHEYGWEPADHDELARGMIAGHVIECGAQATGGNYMGDWRDVDFETIGFPVVAVEPDGVAEITKPDGTGGKVTRGTIAEQLLYEVGDPAAYTGPDVTADFQHVELANVGPDQVRMTGITGKPPTDTYKASLHYKDGWRVRGARVYASPNAGEKAQRAIEYMKHIPEKADIEYHRMEAERIGMNALHDGMAAMTNPEEVVASVSIETPTRQDAREFASRTIALGLGGPPASAPLTPGRPKPRPVFRYHPVLVPKSEFDPETEVVSA
ncbi:acyclic terpene utilization AtuA family protein [Natrinema halophilum]|uniref:acyclic terpene utilization AtuA family protein n=1 Tax=Natrinema halophilum TaxID=1699371 RepID=UPI001F467D27|nr:acyclic terpene utilization AtuA family protein [Natrinema halophilum]UHQ96318.1 DUF1446 domain-containing protein [Natrinema halophilum]